MPITPAQNSVILVTLNMRMNDQRVMAVRAYRNMDIPVGNFVDGYAVLDEFVGLLDAAGTGISFQMATYTSSALKFESIRAQWIWPVRYAYKDYATAVDAGTQGGTPAPQNVNGVVTVMSDNTGPHSHGDIFITGLLAADVVGGLVAPLAQAHMRATATVWTGPYATVGEAATWGAVIFDKTSPGGSEFITHNTAQDQTRIMRRRTVGHGI